MKIQRRPGPAYGDYEQACFFDDGAIGLSAIVVIHSTARGPAVGGCRMNAYPSRQHALRDALQFAKAMSYTAAVMNLPFGGGSSVVIAHPDRDKTDALLRGIGRAVDSLEGRFVVVHDVGTTAHDMNVVRRVTPFAAGPSGADGHTCSATARGVYHGIRAVARYALGRGDLVDTTIAVHGLGDVGLAVCRYLARTGARLAVADTRADLVDRAVAQFGAISVPPAEILRTPVDVLVPCASGGILNDATIPRLRCRAIAGAANNQLADRRHAEALRRRGILYAPDYIVNSGGVIDIANEGPSYDHHRTLQHCEVIHDVLADVIERAERADVTPLAVADRLAERRMHLAAAMKVAG